jgi:hypothetical protein
MGQQLIRFDNGYNNEPKLDTKTSSILNMDFFTGTNISIPLNDVAESSGTPAKKRGRPRKTTIVDGQELIIPDDGNQSDLPKYQSNEPYMDSYNETNNMLKSSVIQIDVMQNDIKTELDQIRTSKTLKKKYDYIAMLSSTVSSLVGTKVTAIREMNKTITDCHNLELKRIKDLKIDAADVDDDKRIMDMYNAFISTPVGAYNNNNPLGAIPTLQDMTLINPNDGIIRTDMMTAQNGYSINPMVQRMVTMENPNIKTVVIYEPDTGRRWFDVINTQTNESVPNVDRPDAMFLEDTIIDVRNGIARNTNLDMSYPLVVLNSHLNQY